MKKFFILITVIFLTAWGASSVNPLAVQSSEETLANKVIRAERLLKESQRVIRYGDYDEGKRLAEEVKKITADVYFLMENGRRYNKLLYSIAVAVQVGAEKWAKEALKEARSFANKAKKVIANQDKYSEFDTYVIQGEEWAKSAIELSKVDFEKRNSQVSVVLTQENQESQTNQKTPDTYVVKLILEKRECLWRIAEYDFIYNDGFKWKILHSANKDIIEDPNLIYPGQVLTIPPLKQE